MGVLRPANTDVTAVMLGVREAFRAEGTEFAGGVQRVVVLGLAGRDVGIGGPQCQVVVTGDRDIEVIVVLGVRIGCGDVGDHPSQGSVIAVCGGVQCCRQSAQGRQFVGIAADIAGGPFENEIAEFAFGHRDLIDGDRRGTQLRCDRA